MEVAFPLFIVLAGPNPFTMKPAAKQDEPFMDEGGVRITRTHLTTPDHSVALAKIESVRIQRVRTGLLARLSGQEPVFRLLVRPQGNAVPVVALETQDGEFIRRFTNAMNKAAASYKGASRTVF